MKPIVNARMGATLLVGGLFTGCLATGALPGNTLGSVPVAPTNDPACEHPGVPTRRQFLETLTQLRLAFLAGSEDAIARCYKPWRGWSPRKNGKREEWLAVLSGLRGTGLLDYLSLAHKALPDFMIPSPWVKALEIRYNGIAGHKVLGEVAFGFERELERWVVTRWEVEFDAEEMKLLDNARESYQRDPGTPIPGEMRKRLESLCKPEYFARTDPMNFRALVDSYLTALRAGDVQTIRRLTWYPISREAARALASKVRLSRWAAAWRLAKAFPQFRNIPGATRDFIVKYSGSRTEEAPGKWELAAAFRQGTAKWYLQSLNVKASDGVTLELVDPLATAGGDRPKQSTPARTVSAVLREVVKARRGPDPHYIVEQSRADVSNSLTKTLFESVSATVESVEYIDTLHANVRVVVTDWQGRTRSVRFAVEKDDGLWFVGRVE